MKRRNPTIYTAILTALVLSCQFSGQLNQPQAQPSNQLNELVRLAQINQPIQPNQPVRPIQPIQQPGLSPAIYLRPGPWGYYRGLKWTNQPRG